jgi:5'-3' exonuclease
VYKGVKEIPMGIYCRKSMMQYLDPDDIFLITKQGFEYFEKTFGLAYPFEKYDQIAVVDFNFGAMENAGAVTFREDVLVFRSHVPEKAYLARANTILHEMAHMWFGDMVTMSWWDDLWLNESFAEWSSYLALSEGTRFKGAWSEFNCARKNWAYRQDQLSSTHPIIADMVDMEAVNANFDGITYAKGASVLHQLVAHVGRPQFIAALQTYFAKHAWANTTLDDLLIELEASSGRKLDAWVKTWLQTAGVNTLRPVLDIQDGTYASIAIAQEAPLIPQGSKELRPHRLAVGLYDITGDVLKLRKSVELDVNGALTKVADLAGEKIADLLLINDRDLSYAKLRFDDRSVATLKSHLGALSDDLARALCWAAVWDMHRDAEISTSDFLQIAFSGLKGETDDAIAYYTQNSPNEKIIVYSSDGDLTQLVSSNTQIYNPSHGKLYKQKDTIIYDHEEILIENVKLVKMMCGDASDNIAGIRGMGVKSLLSLFPELRTEPFTLQQIRDKSNLLFEQDKNNKLVTKLITGVTKHGVLGEEFFEINNSIVSLDEPFLTDEAKDNIKLLMNENLDPEGRSNNNTMRMMRDDGIFNVLPKSDDGFVNFLNPFLRLTRKEKNKSFIKFKIK